MGLWDSWDEGSSWFSRITADPRRCGSKRLRNHLPTSCLAPSWRTRAHARTCVSQSSSRHRTAPKRDDHAYITPKSGAHARHTHAAALTRQKEKRKTPHSHRIYRSVSTHWNDAHKSPCGCSRMQMKDGVIVLVLYIYIHIYILSKENRKIQIFFSFALHPCIPVWSTPCVHVQPLPLTICPSYRFSSRIPGRSSLGTFLPSSPVRACVRAWGQLVSDASKAERPADQPISSRSIPIKGGG